jgi:mRNA-degrading endonuclease toxin of MazEF toxin-antitoxin module
VYWVEYPKANGHEQTGRRPSIVLQDDTFASGSPLVLAIPLTTSARVTRFPAVVPVPDDAQNGLAADSYALVFQLRATDRRRFRDKIGEISDAVLIQLYEALDKLTGRP